MTEFACLQLLVKQTLLFSAAVLMVAALRPLLRRAFDAGTVYLAWLLVPLVLLAPALPQAIEGQVLPGSARVLEELVPTGEIRPVESAAAQAAPQSSDHAQTPVSRPVTTSPRIWCALGTWGTGVMAVLVLLTWRQRRFGARLQRSTVGWIAPAGDSPALLGIWRSRLVLPQDFKQRFSPQEQALILAHEAVHAGRYDNAWNLLAATLMALQWFNPLAWWAQRRMRQDQELACDAAVLNQTLIPQALEESVLKTYLNALLKSHPGHEWPVLSTGWAHQHPLLERVSQLARHTQPAWRQRLGRAGVLGLCLGASALAQATGRLPSAESALPVAPAGSTAPAARPPAPKPAQPPSRTPAPMAVSTSAAPPASPAQPTAAASAAEAPTSQGLLIELDSQQGSEAWERRRMSVVLPLDGSLNSPRPTTMQARQRDWCLGIIFYAGPSDTVRPMAEILDKSCQRTLTDLVELQIGKGPQTLVARLPGKLDDPLQAQITVSLQPPHSAVVREELETPRPALTPEQKAEAERFATEFRRLREASQAQDRAWRQARGEAAL